MQHLDITFKFKLDKLVYLTPIDQTQEKQWRLKAGVEVTSESPKVG
jgi:hypothetical protein